MVHEIILFIHDRTCAADEQQRIAIVQFPYLVRGQQFFAIKSSDELKKGKKICPPVLAGIYVFIENNDSDCLL